MLSNRKVEVVRSYVYLGVTFSASPGKLFMIGVAKNRLTRGYASLSLTKRWLFDALVTPSLKFYAPVVWYPSFTTFHVVTN